MNSTQLVEALPVLFKAKITPMVVGHKGVGKSTTIREYCENNKIGFIDLRLGQMADAGDILGLADLSDGTTRFRTPSMFPRNGQGILFLDEINRATKDVLQAVFQLVLDRKINEYTLPEGWNVVCAMNPPTDEYDVFDFKDLAFKDRFCFVKLENKFEDFLGYVKGKHGNNDVIDFLSIYPKYLNSNHSSYNLDVTPSERSWESVMKLNLENISEITKQEIICGMVGVEAGASYLEFLLTKEDLSVDVEKILPSYEEVREKVLRYSANETNRQDILAATCESLLLLLTDETNKNPLTLQEEKNLKQFFLDLPKDLAYANLKKLATSSAGGRAGKTETDLEIGIFGDDNFTGAIFKYKKD